MNVNGHDGVWQAQCTYSIIILFFFSHSPHARSMSLLQYWKSKQGQPRLFLSIYVQYMYSTVHNKIMYSPHIHTYILYTHSTYERHPSTPPRSALVEDAQVERVAGALLRVALQDVDGGDAGRDVEGHVDKGHGLVRIDVAGQRLLDGCPGGREGRPGEQGEGRELHLDVSEDRECLHLRGVAANLPLDGIYMPLETESSRVITGYHLHASTKKEGDIRRRPSPPLGSDLEMEMELRLHTTWAESTPAIGPVRTESARNDI